VEIRHTGRAALCRCASSRGFAVAEVMPDPFDFYLSSAVVSNGTVYFGSGDANIYALDAAPAPSNGNQNR